MKFSLITILPAVVFTALMAMAVSWILFTPEVPATLHVAGMDNVPEIRIKASTITTSTNIGSGKPSAEIKSEWKGFRGNQSDNISTDTTKLARSWTDQQPKRLWQVDLGEGHAGAAVYDGRVYVLDYDMVNRRDTLRCLSLDNGEQIWDFSYPVEIKNNHGISRTVPAVSNGKVIAFGPMCHVASVDAVSGELVWIRDLRSEFNIFEPPWYAGQCPYVEGYIAYIGVGSKDVLIMAVDIHTGKELWRSPNPRSLTMSHASITPMRLDDLDTIIWSAVGGTVGVDTKTGEEIWFSDAMAQAKTVVPSAVPMPNNRVLLSAGYDQGGALIEVEKGSAKTLKRTRARHFGSEQQTPIYYNGHIYAVLPKNREQLVCYDEDLNELWSSPPDRKFQLAPYLIADGLIIAFNDGGTLTLIEANPNAYVELARNDVLTDTWASNVRNPSKLPPPECWGPMALVEGRLIARNSNRMACFDLRESTK